MKMCHGYGQNSRMLPLTRSRKQLPLPQFSSTLILTKGSGNGSSQGLGFVLTQEDHPVTYASRALTQAEQRYSQIEKELLA